MALSLARIRFAALATAATFAFDARPAQEQMPVVVLTDTVKYCGDLQHSILEHAVRPPEVNRLFAEGRRMCEHGEVRRGILRLRTAIWQLRHRAVAPP